jgi:hypothetical protein
VDQTQALRPNDTGNQRGAESGLMPEKRQTGIVRTLQMELFEIESALSEFELKRKQVLARLATLGAGQKTCTKCNETMDIEQFYRDKQKSDKRSSWCCECKRQDVVARHGAARMRNVISRGAVA